MLFDGMMFRSQACCWQDASPCGNGTIGALMYGALRHDVILLNHEALWDEHPKPTLQPVDDCIPEVRRLLMERKYEQARALFDSRLQAARAGKRTVDAVQPGPDLLIDAQIDPSFTHYLRGVDFQTGRVFITWDEGDSFCERSFFASRANGLGVLHLTSSRPGGVTASFGMIPHRFRRDFLRTSEQAGVDPVIPYEWQRIVSGSELRFEAQYPAGMKYKVGLKVFASGGEIHSSQEEIQVSSADEITVLVAFAIKDEPLPQWPDECDYEQLLAQHTAIHAELYNRTSFSLGSGNDSTATNAHLLEETSQNGCAPDALIQRMFNYGKYLFICAAGKTGLPLHMRGIWNGDYQPPWESDYHNNEELDMMYWPALSLGLSELSFPYFTFYENLLEDYRLNARAIYGARGIMVPTCQGSTHGIVYIGRGGDAGHWAAWTCGAGWVASLFYAYWQYTGDDAFLAEHAVPFLKEIALFYEDFLMEDEQGQMLFIPSLSSENIPDQPGRNMMTINATMDIAIAREVLGNLIHACRHLQIEDAGIPRWQEMLDKLPPYRINEDGALAEWCWDDHPDQYLHRHLSHLYPAFPGREIKPHMEQLHAAALRALDLRAGVGAEAQTGWSYAHIAASYARLGEAERFLDSLTSILRSCTGANLWVYHNDWRAQGLASYWGSEIPVPVHPCANLGITSAITEAIIQSDLNEIRILAALPKSWRSGSLCGIRCHGRITADVLWQEDHLTIRLMSEVDQQVSLMIPGRFASSCQDDSWKPVSTNEAMTLAALKAGQVWSISL